MQGQEWNLRFKEKKNTYTQPVILNKEDLQEVIGKLRTGILIETL